jgi:hypothetical protein
VNVFDNFTVNGIIAGLASTWNLAATTGNMLLKGAVAGNELINTGWDQTLGKWAGGISLSDAMITAASNFTPTQIDDLIAMGYKELSFLSSSLFTRNNVAQYGPIVKGPLSRDIADTFRSGTYTKIITGESTEIYRVIGPNGNPSGLYWTRIQPNGPVQSIIDSALDPKWGNTAINQIRASIPKGSTIYEGITAPQGGLVGGGNQIYIKRFNPKWIQDTKKF